MFASLSLARRNMIHEKSIKTVGDFPNGDYHVVVTATVGGELLRGKGVNSAAARDDLVYIADVLGAFVRGEERLAKQKKAQALKAAARAAMTPLERLKEEAEAIKSSKRHWKSCRDGSYEMALANSRYPEVMAQIKELESK